MSGVDMRGMTAFLAKVKAESTGALYARLRKQAAAEALSLTLDGFKASRDPYGKEWEPLRLRTGGLPLLDTGRFRNSITTELTEHGFRIGTNMISARVHQFGATIVPKVAKALRFSVGRGKKKRWFTRKKVVIPARPYLPRENEPPPAWTRAFQRLLETTMKTWLK
jgi:phage gpG-like protein